MTSNITDLFADADPVETDAATLEVCDDGAGVCPRCESAALSIGWTGGNAWSRTSRGVDDIAVYVCSQCGEDEANEDWLLPGGATPQCDWPVIRRDDSPASGLDPQLEELSRLMAVASYLRNHGGGAWQMMSRKPPEPSRSDPFKPVGEWVQLDEKLWTVDHNELVWWAGHAHPTVRRIVASHETCPPEIIDQLAEDPWVEIRQAAFANMAVDAKTIRRAATHETVEWLREALGESDPTIVGRCARCGGRVKRPDRFLTCTINCSITQARERIVEGTYTKGKEIKRWPLEYIWSVADREAPGGIPGTGPKFRGVYISFIPELNAVEATTALLGLAEREGLDEQEAITAIDRMAQTMTGQAILDACRLDPS